MAHKKSAIKRIRTSEKARQRNVSVKSKVKTSILTAEKAISNKDKGKEGAILAAIKVIDKAASKGIIHLNSAARKKSRLLKKLNLSKK